MKYVVVLGDGMADQPIEELGGKTPLEYAKTPMMDELAKVSEIGMVHTVPDGMSPGSDTANLSVLGYDPKIYYSGRSPLEALSIGVPMKSTDVAIRCNLVTLSEEEDSYEILTDPDDFSAVRETLEEKQIPMAAAEVTMIPQSYVELTDEQDLYHINKLLSLLEEDDDVQEVYHNWDE